MERVDTEYFRIQTFRRDIEEFVITEDTVLKRGDNLLPCHAGIYGKRFDTPFTQIMYLILHQGDKRGNDDTNSFLGEGRYLKCDGLAATGRHQARVYSYLRRYW